MLLEKLRVLLKPRLLLKLRVLLKPMFLVKRRLLSNPGAGAALILIILFLLFAGIFALTQESADDSVRNGSEQDDALTGELLFGLQDEEEPPPGWAPSGPPRWFRSNAGGMTLEEVPSRLAALRNKYALVIDYVASDEVEPRLLPFYQSGYTVEIRVLYEQREESRRQWLFRDGAGVVRLNAVFKRQPDQAPEGLSDETQIELDEAVAEEEIIENNIIENELIEPVELAVETPSPEESSPGEAMPDPDSFTVISNEETAASTGFIELYNEKARIIEDRWFFEDDSEILISYSYQKNTLIKAEMSKKIPASSPEYRRQYTDTYRYNRSFSLRYVERLYHTQMEIDPVRLVFPGRVLDAAADKSFINDKLFLRSEFLGNFTVDEGFRITYDTDSRGRILTQTMIDNKNETVWVIKNTWSGDRIIAMHKTEGKDEKRVEYEYDNEGNQVVQRDINNGVIERRVYTQGENETEELYLNGVVVLRAYWEKGRKIKEEQVRRQ